MTTHLPDEATRRRNVMLLIGIGVALVAVIGVALASRDSSDGDTAPLGGPLVPRSSSTEVTITGEPLPAFRQTSGDPAIGLAAPVIGQPTIGHPVFPPPIPGNEAQPTVVVFLAHWCPHCQRELPLLVDLMESNQLDGVRMIALLTGNDEGRPNWPPGEWLQRERWQGEHLFDSDEDEVARSYGVTGYPFTVFLDAEGKVVSRTSGELPTEQFLALVDLIR